MPVDIVTIPCLADNYAFLMHDSDSGATALVDAPEAAPLMAAIEARNWGLDLVILTHHHSDHVDGLAPLRERFAPEVVGAAADAHRLPPLDRAVVEGDEIPFGGDVGHVLDVSGHTVGHIAVHFPALKALFSADSLMALGCGRVFEGTHPQMWESLSKLRDLPDDTMVYSGHEYTAANARFALTIEPENAALKARAAATDAARAQGTPTVPSELALEKATNPFLRAHLPQVKAALGMENAEDAMVFSEIRSRKDRF